MDSQFIFSIPLVGALYDGVMGYFNAPDFTWQSFWLQVIIIVTGLTGQVLVAKKRVGGFYFWIVGNISIILASIPSKLYGMVFLYMIYNFTALYCIYEWRRDARKKIVESTV